MALSERSMGEPLTTIVITNHNYARFVGEAIESALQQRGTPVEVVVVDDGSTDGSAAVIADFRHRARCIHQTNAGQAAAMNRGFAESRGSLIMFLDADDRLEPDAAARLRAAWRPGVARVHGRSILIGPDGEPGGGCVPTDPLPEGDVRGLVMRSGDYPSAGTTAVAFSRACLEHLLPIPESEWRAAPDVYLKLLSPFEGEVAAVDEVIGRIRIHGGNSWSMDRYDVKRLSEHLEMDARKEALLLNRLGHTGAVRANRWRMTSPAHLQSRLALLRTAPALHPYPEDRAWRLVASGVRASVRHRGFAGPKRIALAAWFLLAGLLPSPVARPLIEAGFVRGRRPAWLQRVLERAFRRGGGAR